MTEPPLLTDEEREALLGLCLIILPVLIVVVIGFVKGA